MAPLSRSSLRSVRQAPEEPADGLAPPTKKEEATVSTEEEESRRVRLEVRGRVGFKELGRDFGVACRGPHSALCDRRLKNPPTVWRRRQRNRASKMPTVPKVLQGLGDEIAEKFLADMEVKVMNSARHHLLFRITEWRFTCRSLPI
jgi:hypothetical protein